LRKSPNIISGKKSGNEDEIEVAEFCMRVRQRKHKSICFPQPNDDKKITARKRKGMLSLLEGNDKRFVNEFIDDKFERPLFTK